jgi:hypothetical protein
MGEAPGWRCYFSTGQRMSCQAGHQFTPCEDVLFGHLKTGML